MDVKKAALKYALQNAVQFDGRANPGAVIGKIISEDPKLKSKIKEIASTSNAVVKEVNNLSLKQQLKKLEELAPELLEKKKSEKRSLAELPNAVKGKVLTRIPPEPSKYAHIGHAISFMINYLYAKKYDGKCIVRFEDTNPDLSKQEYVDAILEDIKYLGIKADKILHVSDDMDKLYSFAEKLSSERHAYICFCNMEKMRESRREGKSCSCRKSSASENKKNWEKMLAKEFKAGEAVLRLKGNMKSKNSVMRDPVLFRISYEKHYLHGNKYVVWPLYDFENAVEDGLQGITHILRSIEFGGMRVELQDTIKQLLKLPKQTITQYGRFNVTDALTQGREIRELIEKKEVSGWDDPRLVTIKALERRGIQPETFADLAVEVGLSTTPTNIDWAVISSFNRKYLDASSKRYFFVENPQEIKIENAHVGKVSLKLHPSDKKASRNFSINDEFLISEKDFYSIKKLKKGLVRLMDCLNFSVEAEKFVLDSLDVDSYRKSGSKIIHWLPSKGNVEAEVLMPDATIVDGLAESFASNIKVGEIVQFTRFGFCKLEEKGKKLKFIYCHD
ncbi:glutamate--tRNA ligase [Candidatus Woesearchaeota archaeon]|nr:glutamate--tRNA ligase [Candidatus Woesearchaeota archaeon]|tara:strand:- start:13510 stop:15192 length:1683 start_codon:yes stop_codon:yes gene_type:complete